MMKSKKVSTKTENSSLDVKAPEEESSSARSDGEEASNSQDSEATTGDKDMDKLKNQVRWKLRKA